MVTFKSPLFPNVLFIGGNGEKIKFENGEYSTSDSAEIDMLKLNGFTCEGNPEPKTLAKKKAGKE